MERPPKKCVCEKCGYLGDTPEHEGCDYLAWTTGEQLYIDHLEAEIAKLRASPASAPEGWKQVPVEPTIEMIEEGNEGFRSPDSRRHTVSSCYKAMLAAAPTPPSTEDRKDAERWIDVSKQLPTNGDDVLCALTDGCVRVLEFNTHPEKRFIDRDTGKWWWIKVGHWMPLPKAPAMQEDKP